ncbi:hypothetical protein JW752_03990 [Candidatus Peregrinibacteria bacterium]|nr:hypothetical protein [Candidatus Peregrinibacteria bacterium]
MSETLHNPDVMSPEEEAAWNALEQKLEREKRAKERRDAIKTLKAAGEEADGKRKIH